MNQDQSSGHPEKNFDPLKIMGVFWLVFGIIVLLSTLFVKGTTAVPLIRGVVTNIIAGLLLFAAGAFCLWRSGKRTRS